jgi:hypothetical protein
MSGILAPTAEALAASIVELADSFGVFASLFAVEREEQLLTWRGGAFADRETSRQRLFGITVVIGDRAGQAWTEDLSKAAAENAFHRARHSAKKNPLLLDALKQLAAREERCPPLLPELEEPDWVDPGFYRPAETHHRHLARELASVSLHTALRVTRERFHAARSDGAVHQATVWRTACSHRFAAGAKSYEIKAGMSAPACGHLSLEPLLASLSRQTEQLQPRWGNFAAPQEPLSFLWPNVQYLIDTELLARLVHAWVQAVPATAGCSSALLLAEAVEGSLGYYPIHPFGYLLGPMAIFSPEGLNQACLEACRTALPFAGHLSLQLPALLPFDAADPTKAFQLLQQRGLLDEELLYVLEGVERFHYDQATAAVFFQPRRVHMRAGNSLKQLPDCLFQGSLHSLFASFVGGMGPVRIASAFSDTDWTVSAPCYSLLQPR